MMDAVLRPAATIATAFTVVTIMFQDFFFQTSL
jgi:hypothetical protein